MKKLILASLITASLMLTNAAQANPIKCPNIAEDNTYKGDGLIVTPDGSEWHIITPDNGKKVPAVNWADRGDWTSGYHYSLHAQRPSCTRNAGGHILVQLRLQKPKLPYGCVDDPLADSNCPTNSFIPDLRLEGDVN